MGITYIPGTVTGPKGQCTLDFLVDSGATYTLLPVDVWQAIGLLPKRTATFSLADGSKVDRQVSECYIALDVGEGHSPVILGEPGDEPPARRGDIGNAGSGLQPLYSNPATDASSVSLTRAGNIVPSSTTVHFRESRDINISLSSWRFFPREFFRPIISQVL